MSFDQAMEHARTGTRVRRDCWQPGWIELGKHQGEDTLFYKSEGHYVIGGYGFNPLYVTYTPYRRKSDGYEEDRNADDWLRLP